jgi:hypothetical protein
MQREKVTDKMAETFTTTGNIIEADTEVIVKAWNRNINGWRRSH